MDLFWESTCLGCRKVVRTFSYGSLKMFLGSFINDLRKEILKLSLNVSITLLITLII
jgi:hypothetical protein